MLTELIDWVKANMVEHGIESVDSRILTRSTLTAGWR